MKVGSLEEINLVTLVLCGRDKQTDDGRLSMTSQEAMLAEAVLEVTHVFISEAGTCPFSLYFWPSLRSFYELVSEVAAS